MKSKPTRGNHKNSLKNLKPIKKGEVRNPIGGNAHNPELRKIRQLTREELAEVGSVILQQDISALKGIAEAKQGFSPVQVWFATIALDAIESKTTGNFNALLDRILGRVAEKIELTGADGGPLTSQSASIAVEALLSDPESFDAMSTLERKLSGFQPAKRKP